jgi:Tol biopolymer transport system component
MKRIVIGILAAFLTAGAQKTDEAERLLKAAANTELVDGDLKAAIEQYRKVSQTPNRGVAAQALIRMAECYQKLGDTESKMIYERVLREFADQKESAAIARARLGRDRTLGEGGVVVRQIWADEDTVSEGQVSADGRYFVYRDRKSGGNLAVRDLASGASRLLTSGASAARGRANYPVFSPDGKQIAYQWRTPQEISVRIVGTDGLGMRTLWKTGDRSNSVIPRLDGWSPDGKHLAIVASDREQATSRIALLSVAEGTLRYLKSTPWRPYPGTKVGGFSPDGRFLVYSFPNGSSSATDGGIFALATDGSVETALVRGPANDFSPIWSPDGQTVVFTSDRSGASGLWAIRVVDGEPQGPPTLLRPNIGDFHPLGFGRNGSLYYGTHHGQTDVYVAGLDAEALRVTRPSSRLTEHKVGSNLGPTWSPDGKWIAFFRGLNARATALVIRSLASGEERTLPVKIEAGAAGNRGANWFPDSRSLLVADTVKDRTLFRRIDIETAQEKVVFEGPYPSTFPVVRLSPDGKTLYYVRRDEREKTNYLIKRNLETGQEVELYRAKTAGIGFFGLAVSPDGARLAFSAYAKPGETGSELMTLSTEGGAPNILYRGLFRDLVPSVGGWTTDGRYVLVGAAEPAGEALLPDSPVRLWAIPADGGERRRLDITLPGLEGLSVSPDGRHLAFAAFQTKGEVWVIQNLLSEMRTSRQDQRQQGNRDQQH